MNDSASRGHPPAVRWLVRCSRLLPECFAWPIGRLLGAWFADLPGRDQRRCRAHLRRAWPGRDPGWYDRTARACFAHFAGMALWSFATLHHSPTRLRRGVVVEGREHFRELIRHHRDGGHAVVIFTGHFGNWELLARMLADLGRFSMIGRRLSPPWVDALTRGLREYHGARQIDREDGVRPLLRELREGRAIATLPDQDIPSLAGIFVPWFGSEVFTPSGPALLSIAGGSSWCSVFCYRRGDRWVVHCSPLRAAPPRGGERDATARAITARAMAYQEALVRRHPEQWVWWHKRWRTADERLKAEGRVRKSGCAGE